MINLVCFVKNLGNSSVTQNKQNQFQELFTQVVSSILTLVPFSFRSPYFSSKKLHFFLIIVFQSITKTHTFQKIDNIIYFHYSEVKLSQKSKEMVFTSKNDLLSSGG